MSRSFNGVLEDSEVSYHSNDFLVVELVITLPKCPHVKQKMSAEGNRSYYTHDDSDGLSNSDEYDQEIKLLMAY